MLSTLDAVRKAAARIEGVAHRTPVLTNTTLNALVGAEVYFKAECYQKTGSFKFRGALNAVLSMSDEEAAKGVVTHSSGNHGQALAAAAKFRGIPATIVVPRTAAKAKIDAIRGYGAKVVLCEPTQSSRVGTMFEQAEQMGGASVVPPYEHLDVIAGQGTIALEFVEQVPNLDAILVPTSGGGMLSGVCTVTAAMCPRTRAIAVEPKGKKLAAAFEANTRVLDEEEANRPIPTIVDAMPTQCLGPMCWDHVYARGDHTVLTVDDEEIERAMAFVYSRMKVVVEPAAATGVAALLNGRHKAGANPIVSRKGGDTPPKIGVILCGGNIDLATLQTRFAHLAKL